MCSRTAKGSARFGVSCAYSARFDLRGDISHSGDYDLEHRADFAADEVSLIDDEEGDVLHVLPLLPSAREHVPPLRRSHDELATLEQLQVGGGLPC
jgi:hypothetical protein